MTTKSIEYCPSCRQELDHVVGLAEEMKYSKKELHVLEVLRCRNCNYNEIQEDINCSKELDNLILEVWKCSRN